MAGSRHSGMLKVTVLAVIIIALIIIALFAYLTSELSHINQPKPAPSKLYTPSVSGTLINQNLLLFNNLTMLVPYELLSYKAVNATSISFNASISIAPPPTTIYMLNASGECYECGNMASLTAALKSDILNYGMINASSISNISLANVANIKNYSLLVIPNGLLPNAFIEPVNSSTSLTLLDILMAKGTIIIYIGDNFSRVLLPGSVISPSSTLPSYLDTVPYAYKGKDAFYFNSTTFSFANGYDYGPITYEYEGAGAIIAFSNTQGSWKNESDVAADISKAIFESFWVPQIASGGRSINLTAMNYSGVIGLPLMNSTLSTGNYKGLLNSSFGKITIKASFSSSKGTRTHYSYIYFSPEGQLNGTISMPINVTPGYMIQVPMTIFTNSSVPISIQPHISIYNINMSETYSIPLPFSQAYGNFTFIKYMSVNLPPGAYIAILQGYSNNQYAAALFNVSKIEIGVLSANFTRNNFRFYIYANKLPVSNINYTISLNGLYKHSGAINNGVINYSLPNGTPQVYGNMRFTVSMLSQNFTYTIAHTAPKITVNKQYIEIAIVVIVVILMVTLVKAPNKDEFYIDMPSLPQLKKVDIKVPLSDILSQFDKLNVRYHWKFMPLSKSELRSAISSNLRYNNMPVGVTYSNVDMIVDQLSVKGYILGVDNLYAPAEWVQKSGHDIEYLATFKKLRVYFVTHAYMFTDLDASNLADIVTTIHGERAYIVIYSNTSKFLKVPVYANQTTYIAFLNAFKLEEFKQSLYASYTKEAEQLKIYISTDSVKLVDADAPEGAFA